MLYFFCESLHRGHHDVREMDEAMVPLHGALLNYSAAFYAYSSKLQCSHVWWNIMDHEIGLRTEVGEWRLTTMLQYKSEKC